MTPYEATAVNVSPVTLLDRAVSYRTK
jgi:hypothetical protein